MQEVVSALNRPHEKVIPFCLIAHERITIPQGILSSFQRRSGASNHKKYRQMDADVTRQEIDTIVKSIFETCSIA